MVKQMKRKRDVDHGKSSRAAVVGVKTTAVLGVVMAVGLMLMFIAYGAVIKEVNAYNARLTKLEGVVTTHTQLITGLEKRKKNRAIPWQ